MPMTGSFNANQYEPNQGFTHHPPAQKIPFTITGTVIKENSAKDGGYFMVEFTTPLGNINNIYNIWSKTPKAVEIAHGQLSALCRAVGRFQIDWGNDGAALRGAPGLMDVGYQKGEEPSPDNPNAKGYTEVKKVYDPAGNDPSKPGATQAQAQPQNGFVQQQPQGQAQPQNQPMQQQPGGGWGNQAPQGMANPQPAQPQQNGNWNGNGAPQQQPQHTTPLPANAFQQGQPPQQQPQAQPNGGQAWQPGGAPQGQTPPWGNR